MIPTASWPTAPAAPAPWRRAAASSPSSSPGRVRGTAGRSRPPPPASPVRGRGITRSRVRSSSAISAPVICDQSGASAGAAPGPASAAVGTESTLCVMQTADLDARRPVGRPRADVDHQIRGAAPTADLDHRIAHRGRRRSDAVECGGQHQRLRVVQQTGQVHRGVDEGGRRGIRHVDVGAVGPPATAWQPVTVHSERPALHPGLGCSSLIAAASQESSGVASIGAASSGSVATMRALQCRVQRSAGVSGPELDRNDDGPAGPVAFQ